MRLVGDHGLDFDPYAGIALVRNDVGDHRALASSSDILPVGLPRLLDDGRAGVLVEQVGRAAWRL